MFTRTLLLAIALLSVFFESGAQAQGPRTIQLEEFVIEGEIQKPNAFYILNRASLGYEVMDLRTSFVDEILESVREEPFK